eukprot:jgi/Hompol1/17/HPOL_002706-RA
MTENTEFNVAVIGGGLVGALSAVYFAKRGYKVNVYEKRKDIRTEKSHSGRSINLALSVRGIAGLTGAGVEKTILPTIIPMKGRMIHSLDGSLSSQPYGLFGECINSVDRRLVNEHLLTAAEKYPNLKLHFELSVESADFDNKRVVLSGPSGKTTIFPDLVIGADGAYSRVRSELLKKVMYVAAGLCTNALYLTSIYSYPIADTDRLPLLWMLAMLQMYRGRYSQEYIDHAYVELTLPATHDGKYAIDPDHLHIWPRNTFMMIALPNTDKSFTVTLFMPWEKFNAIKTDKDLIDFFEKTFPDAVPKIGKAFLVQEYFQNPKGALISIKCNPYHYKDHVVILGDAAHAMVPFYGQGMNCGFEDALVLDEIFTKHLGPAPATLDHKHPVVRPTPAQIEAILKEYSTLRNPDAEAMCDLALYNYNEMRDSVTRIGYKVRKTIEGVLHRIFPKTVIPLYTMVSFSRIRYSEVIARWKRQTAWFDAAKFYATWGIGWTAVGLTAFAIVKHNTVAKNFVHKTLLAMCTRN